MTNNEKNAIIERMISDPDWGIAQLKAVKAHRENKKALIQKDQSRTPTKIRRNKHKQSRA